MNIRQIISEAIDRTVLANYSAQMGRYLGEFGLDPTPLGNDRTSLSFIKEFNSFCFQVKDAIDTKNYRPSTGRVRQTTPGVNGLERNKYQPKPGDNWATKFVNKTVDVADDVYHYTGNEINLDPVFGGMARSFRNGYNDGVDFFKPDPTKQQPQQQQPAQPRTRRTRPAKTGVPLTTLMGDTYRKVIADYRSTCTVNQTGLSRVRGLRELLTILQDVKNALSQS
jgi:hypothetical protein